MFLKRTRTFFLIKVNMGNVDWSGIAQAGAGLLGTIFNASSAAGTNKETMRFTEQQQEKQNKFSHDEAELARKFLDKMSSSEISRRVADMRASGLNPAFALGMSGDSVGSAPQAQAPSVSSPNLRAPQVDPLTLSQIELNKSQAKKNEAEAENTEKATDWMDMLNQATINYQGSCVDVNGSVVRLNEAEKQKIAQVIEESKQKVENLRKEVELLDSQITMNDIDAFWKSGKYSAEIDSLLSSARLNEAEAKEIIYLMTSRKHLLEAQTASYRADVGLKRSQERFYNTSSTEHYWLGRMAYWDAGSSKISFQLYDKFGEFDKYFDYTERGINTACHVAEQFLGWKKGLAQIKQGERSLDQRDRDLDYRGRDLDRRDREFELRNLEHNDRQFNADRSYKQHERDFGEKMREQQRQFNAKYNQRERFHDDFLDRFRKPRYYD